jgi:hypothetical protein
MGNSLAHVQTIHVGALTGEAGFGRKLIEALQRLERFELTEDAAHADAILDADGDDQEQGFLGTATLHDAHGAVLWTARALRPHGGSGPMAYERLIAALVAEVGLPDQSRAV